MHLDGEKALRIQQKLLREVGPIIGGALVEEGVVEIALNPDGVIWIEKLGSGFEKRGEMAAAAAEALMNTIATCLHTTVTRENPILEGELPIDGSRFEGLLPPIVAQPTFTIRRKASRVFTLDEYVSQGVITPEQHALLLTAVDKRQNILVGGGTGSGKTTFTNAIIDSIAKRTPDHRIIIIEDTSEIQCTAPNVATLHTSDTVDMLRLLRATMRLKPDRIIVGETRGAEALSLLKAWNTGHPGGVATVHANNGVGALIRLEQLIAEASPTPMPHLIAQAVNLVAMIERCPGGRGRRLSEILHVTGYDHQACRYTFETLSHV